MTRLEAAQRAIHFKTPPYIPMIRYEDLDRADIVKIPVANPYGKEGDRVSEWGFEWYETQLDFALGQIKAPALPSWDMLDQYKPAHITADTNRFDLADELMQKYPDRYYLADFVLSGFTIMAFVRGFEDLMTDFYLGTH